MTNRIMFDIGELKKAFRIIDGKLERLNRRVKTPTWKIVENKADKGHGYCQVDFNRRGCRYHVILWVLYHNENIPEGFEIDHINGNRIDNKIENLRLVSRRGNCQNLAVHRNGKLVGAFYCKKDNKYQSQIKINNKNIGLGYFNTEFEANKAYKIACKYVDQYVDNNSFRAIIKQNIE